MPFNIDALFNEPQNTSRRHTRNSLLEFNPSTEFSEGRPTTLTRLYRIVQAVTSAVTQTSFSSRSSTFLRGVSPLLISSDSGTERMIHILLSACHREPGASCRPRVLGMLKQQNNNFPKNEGENCSLDNKIDFFFPINGMRKIITTEKALDEFKCPICLDIFETPAVTPCRHIFCAECIIISLLQQSLCPLCRASVYMHQLHLVLQDAAAATDVRLKRIFSQYSQIVVECPKCLWVGTIKQWSLHYGSPDCELREKTLHEVPPAQFLNQCRRRRSCRTTSLSEDSTNRSGTCSFLPPWDTTPRRRKRPLAFVLSQYQMEQGFPYKSSVSAASQPSNEAGAPLLLTASSSTAPPPLQEEEVQTEQGSRSSASEDNLSIDRLACWLIDNPPGTLVRLYVLLHRMENLLGAVMGTLSSSAFSHAQAVLEFNSVIRNSEKKTFLSMELYGDLTGLQWHAYNEFPPIRSVAQKIEVYQFKQQPDDPASRLNPQAVSVSPDLSNLVDFVMHCRSKTYNIIGWNCHTFISDLKQFTGISGEPFMIYDVPRPTSYSESLMQFLSKLKLEGSLPTLAAQVPASGHLMSSVKSWVRRKIHSTKRFLPARNSESAAPAASLQTASTTDIYVSRVTLCLFPAEDLHRASLWPATTVSRFLNRSLSLIRPDTGRESAREEASLETQRRMSPSSSEGLVLAANTRRSSKITIPQLRLRYQTLPILLFHVKTKKFYCPSSVCFISLEFRSDYGLWWHVYKDLPPGLNQPSTSGGTDLVVSADTDFSLDELETALLSTKNNQYEPVGWTGWEFFETILQHCCPSVAQNLLDIPAG